MLGFVPPPNLHSLWFLNELTNANSKSTNAIAELTNAITELTNANAKSTNAIAEIANANPEITNGVAEITNAIALLYCCKTQRRKSSTIIRQFP